MSNFGKKTIDKVAIEKAVREILIAIGEDPDREGLKGTPDRVARMYEEIFSGLHQDPREHLKVLFKNENHEEMVVVKDIPFYSSCEHHLVPFFGKAHVVYVPKDGRLTGLSKLARGNRNLCKKTAIARKNYKRNSKYYYGRITTLWSNGCSRS